MHCIIIFVLHQKSVIKSILFFLCFSVFLFSCSSQATHSNPQWMLEITPSQQNALLVNEKMIWEDKEIPVCWMEDDPGFQSQWLRHVVRESAMVWENVSQVRFIGWASCQGKEDGIQIKLGDSMRWSGMGWSFIGHSSREKNPSLFLSINQTDEYQLRVLAMHHFGHALGFEHEQKRQDTPDDCVLHDARHDNGTYKTIGPYDHFSVMNYCNPYWSESTYLSALDILGVQNYYGIP